jgi:DNA-binding protein HU-beta
MNKAQLVAALADRLGDRAAAALAVDELLDVIVRAVHAGDSVTIPGFGVFERRERAARTGRNPQTGATIALAATSVPGFRAGVSFRDVVSGARTLPAAGPPGVAAAKGATTSRARTPAAPVPAANRATTPPAATQSAPMGEDAGRRQNGKAEAEVAEADKAGDKSGDKAGDKAGDKGGKGGKKSHDKDAKPGKPEKRDKGAKKKRSKK